MVDAPPELREAESTERNRAQLILVGAVALAVVVLGLVVVFNTVLYTENVASSGSVNAPQEAQQVNREARFQTKQLIRRVNAGDNWTTDSDAFNATIENVSNFSAGLTNVTAASKPAFVSIQLDPDPSNAEYGARVKDDEPGDFTSPTAVTMANWNVTSQDGTIVRGFEATIEKSDLGAGNGDAAFGIVWNESGSSNNHVVWVYENSTNGNVTIRTLNNSAAPKSDFSSGNPCELSGDSEFEFDFTEGTIEGFENCSAQMGPWNAGISNDSHRSIEFVNADNVSGNYSLVLMEQSEVGEVLEYTVGGQPTPYWTHAVWEIEMTVTYETGRVAFTDTYEIGVYNSSR